MRSSRTTRAIATAALLPLLVFAVGVARMTQLRCLITGIVSPACCCPAGALDADPPSQPTAAAGDCCAREEIDLSRPPSVPAAAHQDQGCPVLLPTPVRLQAQPRFAAGVLASPPAPSRPPTPLLKHALLI